MACGFSGFSGVLERSRGELHFPFNRARNLSRIRALYSAAARPDIITSLNPRISLIPDLRKGFPGDSYPGL